MCLVATQVRVYLAAKPASLLHLLTTPNHYWVREIPFQWVFRLVFLSLWLLLENVWTEWMCFCSDLLVALVVFLFFFFFFLETSCSALLSIVSNSYMNLIVGLLVSKQIPLYCKCLLSNMETHVQCWSTDLNFKGQSSLAAWGLNAHLGMLLLWSAVAVLQACRGPPSLRLQAFFLAFGDVYHFLFVKLRNPEEHG